MLKLCKLVLICTVLAVHIIAVSPAKADESLDLIIDEGVIVPWEINNISPGSSGQVSVDIRNAGSDYGFLAVWIDGIVDSEGENPESETGDTEEPGELSQYLTLSISGGFIDAYTASPAFVLPVALSEFPQSIDSPLQLNDSPLHPNLPIQIQWEWAISPQVTNIIQGDRVSFNIHYILTQDILVQRPSTSTPTMPEGGYLPKVINVADTQDDDNEEILEDINDYDTEADEQDTTDASGNVTIIHSTETDTTDDSREAMPTITDDNFKPTLPDIKDSQSKIDLKNISSIKSTSAQEMLSQICLIVAVCGTLVMVTLAYIERKRRDRRRVVKG